MLKNQHTIKNITAAALLATTIFTGFEAKAADGGKFYLSLTGEYIIDAKADGSIKTSTSLSKVSSNYKNGVGGMAAIGYYFTDNIRAEIEGAYRKINGDTSSVTIAGTTYTIDSSNTDAKAFSTMANIYFNLPTEGKLSPYVGIGAGWAREQEEGANALAYQAMAGIDYKISKNSTIFTGYRYFATTDFKDKYTIAGLGVVTEEVSVKAHAIDIGYRFSF